jgi:hypothetical protein
MNPNPKFFERKYIMNIHTIAASILALGLLSPVAFAGSNDQCSQVNNRIADYGPCTDSQSTETYSTKPFSAEAVQNGKRDRVGDFIDETPEETNQRSGN